MSDGSCIFVKDPYHRDHQVEEGFFFFLKNNYDPASTLTFSSLKGEDSHLAFLLRCFPSFIGVHLTVVKQIFKEECIHGDGDSNNDDEPFLSAFSWVHPEIGPVQLSGMDGYPRGRLIDGLGRKMHQLPGDRRPTRTEEENGFSRSTYLTPALCIWPKKESLPIYLKYGFDALLDRMESSSADCYDGLEGVRELVDAIALNPVQVWKDPDTGGADRARRTLRLIVKLGAKEEGLRLLKLLDKDFCGKDGKMYFEGIRDEAVAEAIAEFECHVGGQCQNTLKLYKIQLILLLYFFFRLARLFRSAAGYRFQGGSGREAADVVYRVHPLAERSVQLLPGSRSIASGHRLRHPWLCRSAMGFEFVQNQRLPGPLHGGRLEGCQSGAHVFIGCFLLQ